MRGLIRPCFPSGEAGAGGKTMRQSPYPVRPPARNGPRPGSALQRRGFTLLEVLVALAIMATAVTLLMQLFAVDLRAIAASGSLTSATLKGEARIREILAEPLFEERSWSEEGPEGYRMDITVAEEAKPRTEKLPVRLMDVQLVVRWQEGRKERSLLLKTQKLVDRLAPAGQSGTSS